jgi:murein DD-endopeptidase MepM/ murein hydrolase activator NlpD
LSGVARPTGLTQKAAAREQRERARIRSRRVRRLGVLAIAIAIVVPILILVFDEAESTTPVPLPPAERLLPGGPPARQFVASQGALRVFLPIAQDKVTAVGYHGVDDGALALDPVGIQGNAGVFTRLLRRLFGQERGTIRYYLISGGSGPSTAGLDVGAPPGTDVYAPVDGTVVGITDNVLAGERYGVRIDVQPSGSPGLVVSIENVEADEALTVGSVVSAARTRLGSLIDLSNVETAALAEFTTDSGQHVHLEVRPAANLALP